MKTLLGIESKKNAFDKIREGWKQINKKGGKKKEMASKIEKKGEKCKKRKKL